ncbi:YceD family protein [Legionella spiritensis]|uniref:YceD family protein n=1 Tax=Legionella spiritensis TaxID=452 RepID=UPI000F6FA91C|nr:YceD family protein [Legionella spiritensis]VEG90052.1 metal-binding, possibly nucleic acid-binding protein [Legionella spiritensis]
MLVRLRSAPLQTLQHIELELTERIPSYIDSPVNVQCDYRIEQRDDYYLMSLAVSGHLTVVCQRCLHSFPYHYSNHTDIAICASEEKAEKLMADYDCIVASNYTISLQDLIADELYLYTPENHPEKDTCDPGTTAYIRIDNAI